MPRKGPAIKREPKPDPVYHNPLATQFGIHILPTLFVVGRDGRVTNNAVQVSDVETELKKVQ